MVYILIIFYSLLLLSQYCDAFIVGGGNTVVVTKSTIQGLHPITDILRQSKNHDITLLYLTNDKQQIIDDALKGIVELPDNLKDMNTVVQSTTTTTTTNKSIIPAPFLSQGDIDPATLNPDLSDPKQARVIIYILLSLIPVLFLIPLMLGSRELIPLEVLPPVQL